jgi:hypothetical protein
MDKYMDPAILIPAFILAGIPGLFLLYAVFFSGKTKGLFWIWWDEFKEDARTPLPKRVPLTSDQKKKVYGTRAALFALAAIVTLGVTAAGMPWFSAPIWILWFKMWAGTSDRKKVLEMVERAEGKSM